jgi:MoaD family protein
MPVVKFYANLRNIVGVKEKVIPGENMGFVLDSLIYYFPKLKTSILEGDKLLAIITLNGKTLDPEIAFQVPVSELDEIAIFPPMSGG